MVCCLGNTNLHNRQKNIYDVTVLDIHSFLMNELNEIMVFAFNIKTEEVKIQLQFKMMH